MGLGNLQTPPTLLPISGRTRAISGTTDLEVDDGIIECTATLTLNMLPAAQFAGRILIIKNTSLADTVSIDCYALEEIETNAIYLLDYGECIFITPNFAQTGWMLLSRYSTIP